MSDRNNKEGRFEQALEYGLDAVEPAKTQTVESIQWQEIILQQVIRDISNGVESPKALAWIEGEEAPVFIKLMTPKDVLKYFADYDWLSGLGVPVPPWIKAIKFQDKEMYGIMYPDLTEQGKYYYVSYNDAILNDEEYRQCIEALPAEVFQGISQQVYEIMQKISGVHGDNLEQLLPGFSPSVEDVFRINRKSLVQTAKNTDVRFRRILPGVISFQIEKTDPSNARPVCSDLGEDILASELEGKLTQFLYYYFLNCADGANAMYKVFGHFPELPKSDTTDIYEVLKRHIFSMV